MIMKRIIILYILPVLFLLLFFWGSCCNSNNNDNNSSNEIDSIKIKRSYFGDYQKNDILIDSVNDKKLMEMDTTLYFSDSQNGKKDETNYFIRQ